MAEALIACGVSGATDDTFNFFQAEHGIRDIGVTGVQTCALPIWEGRAMIREFRLPDLGEGLTESELVLWRVHEGDTVDLDQVIAEVETAKAMVELPSPHAGDGKSVVEGKSVDVGGGSIIKKKIGW